MPNERGGRFGRSTSASSKEAERLFIMAELHVVSEPAEAITVFCGGAAIAIALRR